MFTQYNPTQDRQVTKKTNNIAKKEEYDQPYIVKDKPVQLHTAEEQLSKNL
jgi:hypothetical protein